MAPARATLSVGSVSKVNDVWTCRWSFGLLLFYLNRYLPLLDLFLFLRPILSGPVPERECKIIFPMTFWLVTIGLIISQAILVLRTYAIWGCRRLILWILIPIAIILFGSMLAFTAWKTCLDYSRLKSSPDGPFPDAVKCTTVFLTVDNERRIALLILYAMVFLGEAVIVSLTMIRANQDVDKFTPRLSQFTQIVAVTLANASVIFAASES
ncbi:hypothetical protein CVT25_014783 [Psilocybe cyanescens]|uniref:Uncharacterized protein n=1 Tax=Psilocybe cyanescens TaxID=93625 RepID=A0A409XID6_PSICY|nr:hypothetical protein CVT25_014783 [Psilocybe cyanescens]